MPNGSLKVAIGKFPLRLMPSVRSTAERFSKQEGVSLNQFINVAVAERLARLEHEEWVRNRAPVKASDIDRALEFLDSLPNLPPEPGDELPEGYVSVAARFASSSKKVR